MSGPNWDRFADQIDNDLESGNMTPAEHREAMRDLRDEMRGYAEEQSERAYNDAMEGW